MNAPLVRLARERSLPLGAVVLAALLVLGFRHPGAVVQASHAAFLVLVPAPVGAMLLLLIGRLTGGEWVAAANERLRTATRLLPFVSLLALPPLLGSAHVYEWVGKPELILHEDVAHWYLGSGLLAARTIATLLVWSAFGWMATSRVLSKPFAGLGLCVFGLTVSTAGVDWVLALGEPARSTAFPMSLAVSFLLAGAAWGGRDAKADRAADWSKLAATFALGLIYLDAMQFLVAYDGNLPEQARWYAERGGWAFVLLVVAFVLAGLLPVLAVFKEAWRRSTALRRLASSLIPLGVAARILWFVVPSWDAGLAFWMALVLLVSGFTALASATPSRRAPRREQAA